MKYSKHISYLCLVSVAILFSSCGSGNNSSNNSNVIKGNLSFSNNGELQVSNGSIQKVVLLLNNSKNIVNQKVNLLVDDPTVASITPKSCNLSSIESSCIVTVNGNKVGSTAINAIADGYQPISLSSSVINGPVYGNLGVQTTVFANDYPLYMESSPNPLTIKYSSYVSQTLPALNDMPAGDYYTIYVTGGLLNSSGITSNDGAIFNVAPTQNVYSTSGYGYHSDRRGGEQCNVTSSSPICTLVFYIPKLATINNLSIKLNAQIAGTAAPNYSPLNLVAQADSNEYPGQIDIGYQTNNIPLNMHSPIFVNWNKVAMNGTVTLQLQSNSPNVQFYNYNVESNVAIESLSSTATCYLQFPQTATIGTANNYGVSCGLGVKGVSLGNASISATVTSQNVSGYTESYTISPISLSVVNQASAIRTITVTNTSIESIALGITTGGANSYISPSTTAFVPSSVSSLLLPAGGGSQCGPSNSFAACPTGSTCLPGGLNPESTSVYYCYYDTPSIESYILLPNQSTNLSISSSSGESDPSGIIWSGNFFARTGCNESGLCTNGTCGKNGLACAPGTGGAPGVMTLSEATFQRGTSPDYYDVSIINGLNFATQFGPSSIESSGYFCGMAGGFNAQSGDLPAALWGTTPNSSDTLPYPSSTANLATGESNTYFRWVSYETSPTSCTTDSTCTTINADYRCGFIISTDKNAASITDQTIPINESTTSYTRYCGKPISWLTVDSMYGFENNGAGVNTLPFNLTAQFSVSIPNQTYVTTGNLQLCNANTYSAYGAIPAGNYGATNLACGGVDWQTLGITHVTSAPTISNPNWVDNVQPTITWLKQTCPTCYTFPYDDMASTFTCVGARNYNIDIKNPPTY